ncbi:uncharacterized protein PAC_16198 [Phialocephala subalpina]|uniref:Heterokaryon incompatibility domain-containing protein n=1 Tax=Phialocephala subalpina TaxID=576137 RepID=A0A1L7XMY4_9HELO|nr:uncharacterized protein PAC_16198 [Phialocephala subalpina]
MAASIQFTYPPIDTDRGEIRLLNINPGKQGDDLVLSFEVLRVEDDSKVDFDAISYRWESQANTQLFLASLQPYFLTDSQRRVIQDLRYTDCIRRIWIDAICIDQGNITERSQQIQLMRIIYSKARHVCIWLNYGLDRDSLVYHQFLRLEHELDYFTMLEGGVDFWDPICNIFEHEYFRRVWVQQEISSAARLSLQCRKTVLPLACLIPFLRAWEELRSMHSADEFGQRTTYGNEPMDLLEVLCRSRELACTDQRDIVYGLMFLSHGWRQFDLIADYTLPVSEVYRQAMIACFTVYGTLAFLEHANFSYDCHKAIMDRTPSWVPDFRKKSQRQPRRNLWLRQDKGVPLRQDYSHLARFSGHLLYTCGAKIADIEQCFDFWSQNGGVLDVSVHTFAQSFNQIIEESRLPVARKNRTLRLVWLLTEAASPSPNGLGDEEFVEAAGFFANCFEPPADDLRQEKTPLTLNQLRGGISRHNDLGELDAEGDEAEDLFSTVSVMLMNLCYLQAERATPFICAAGSIGLASLETRLGDEIWLIPTCPRPIVLRPKDGKHSVLGRAWYEDDMTWNESLGACDSGCSEAFVNARTEICLK